jgi:carbon-monoxide dehydrogenase large subunit
MQEFGIGASALRKEDDRFLRGRGQYVGDVRLAGMRDVAFVRSPTAHARLTHVHIPSAISSSWRAACSTPR